MLGSSPYGNRQVDAIAFKKDGEWWARAVTAASTATYGAEPFRIQWALSANLKVIRSDDT